MKLDPVIQPGDSGYYYLASPFTRYPLGHQQAWRDVSLIRGQLLIQGIYSYSPIAESYGAVQELGLPIDHVWWKGDNMSKMIPAIGIIMCRMLGWHNSDGMKRERRQFEEWGRPVVWLDP